MKIKYINMQFSIQITNLKLQTTVTVMTVIYYYIDENNKLVS